MADPDDGGRPAEPIDTVLYNRLLLNFPGATELNLHETVESVLRDDEGYESPNEDAAEEQDEEQDEEEREAARERRRQQRRRFFAQQKMLPLVRALIRGLPQNRFIRKVSIRSAFLWLLQNDMRDAFFRAITGLSALEHFEIYHVKGDEGCALPVSEITAVARNARGLKVLKVAFPWFSSQREVESLALALNTRADSLVAFTLQCIWFPGGTAPNGFSLDPVLRSLSNMPSLRHVGYTSNVQGMNGRDCCSDDTFAALCSLSSLEFLVVQLFSFRASHKATLERLLESSTLKSLLINPARRHSLQLEEADEQALLHMFENSYGITDQVQLGIVSEAAQEKIQMFARLNKAGRGDLLKTDRYKSKAEWIKFFIKISDHPIDDIIYMLKINPAIWACADTANQGAPTGHVTAAMAREDGVVESGHEAPEGSTESPKRAADT